MSTMHVSFRAMYSVLPSCLIVPWSMVRPVPGMDIYLQNIDQNCLKKARRVVKKYKKITLKKEMSRLRQLPPKGEKLKQHEVLDQTILLEMKLLTRIKQAGMPQMIATLMENSCGQSFDNFDLNS